MYAEILVSLGYEDLESVVIMSEEEIDELSTSINMRPGHKRKFPVAIMKAKEEGMKSRQRSGEKKR
jgi:hypothetical protein